MPARVAAASIPRTVIRVMVNYTDLAAASTGDILGLITLAVAETNQSYAELRQQRRADRPRARRHLAGGIRRDE